MPHLQLLSLEPDSSHAPLASSQAVTGCYRVAGISSEVCVRVVFLNEPAFPVGPPGELDTVAVLQAELQVSHQSGWEHGVQDFPWPKLVGSQSLIQEEWSLILEWRNTDIFLLLSIQRES